MKVHLQIDRLVLDGLAITPQQATLLQAALAHELARRMAAASGAGLRSGAVHALKAPELRLEGQPTPAELGSRLAAAIHAGLGGLR